MQANFKTWVQETNKKLEALSIAKSDSSKLENAIELGTQILSLISKEAILSPEEIVGEHFLNLPNADRFDSWFHNHPDFAGPKSIFELLDGNEPRLQAKLYWLKKRSNSLMAGAVHFTPNWEDGDSTRNDNRKVGIDFFLSPDAQSFHVALSNYGKLRVLELAERLTNTDIEVLEKWHNLVETNNLELLHSTIWDSFKLQSVNTKFYHGVADAFTELHDHLVELGKSEHEAKMFASRLLGRLIFIWFIRKMGLISKEFGYFEVSNAEQGDYYRKNLERLFFNTLNLPVAERIAENSGSLDTVTPYLNGGLFSPRQDDWIGEEISFPEAYFNRLFEHFEKFNFTTDESTPEYEQVAIDPEMLGRVFESLLASQLEETGEQARKAKGAFYTPREVVAHMCKEAVRAYLLEETENSPTFPNSVNLVLDKTDQDWAKDGSNSLRDISVSDREKIIEKLENLKSIDPACGSGAFPLGLLQLLTRSITRLRPKANEYDIKLGILQNNIFGADIEPMAVEISRLRAWLALVVSDVSNAKSVKPLPNLDFKFVCANSLAFLEVTDHLSLFDDEDLGVKLQSLRDSYFSTQSTSKKLRLKEQYAELVKEEFTLFGETKRTSQLKSFKPFDSDTVADFFDPDEMFGVHAFDIVIGNPPYVSVKGISKEAKKEFSKTFATAKGRFNLFTLFLERGQKLLKPMGQLTYILPDSLFSHTEYRHIREYLVKNTTLLGVTVFSKRVFEAAVDTAIVHFENGNRERAAVVRRDLSERIAVLEQAELSASDDYLFPIQVSDENREILEAIKRAGISKLDSFFDIQQGIIYSGQAKEDVFANTKLSPEYKPVLDGRDILRSRINWEEKLENRFIKYSPSLHRARDEKIFLASPKIVLPRRSTSLVCAVDEKQFYALNTAYVLMPRDSSVDNYYFVGLLNSSLIAFFYSSYYFGWQITIPALKSLPIALGNSDEQTSVASLSKQLHEKLSRGESYSQELVQAIDDLVFKIYGLSEIEISKIPRPQIGK